MRPLSGPRKPAPMTNERANAIRPSTVQFCPQDQLPLAISPIAARKGSSEDGVCVVPALADAHLAVVDPDLPLACALDVEEVRVGHAGRLRSVGAALQTVEELPDGHGSNPISVTGSSFCCTRRGGSLAARA